MSVPATVDCNPYDRMTTVDENFDENFADLFNSDGELALFPPAEYDTKELDHGAMHMQGEEYEQGNKMEGKKEETDKVDEIDDGVICSGPERQQHLGVCDGNFRGTAQQHYHEQVGTSIANPMADFDELLLPGSSLPILPTQPLESLEADVDASTALMTEDSEETFVQRRDPNIPTFKTEVRRIRARKELPEDGVEPQQADFNRIRAMGTLQLCVAGGPNAATSTSTTSYDRSLYNGNSTAWSHALSTSSNTEYTQSTWSEWRFDEVGELPCRIRSRGSVREYRCGHKDCMKKPPNKLRTCDIPSELRKHWKECHSAAEVRKLKCDECDETFHWPKDLKRHKMSHSKERPNRCEKCGRDFGARKDNFVRHVKLFCKGTPRKHRGRSSNGE